MPIFGKFGKSIHSYRLFNVDVVDMGLRLCIK
jgi:hypothetical protein